MSFWSLILEMIGMCFSGDSFQFDFRKYLEESSYNLIDIGFALLQIAYALHRILDPEHVVLPVEYHKFEGEHHDDRRRFRFLDEDEEHHQSIGD